MTTKNSFGKNDGKYFTYSDLLTTETIAKSLKTRLDFIYLATVLVVVQYLTLHKLNVRGRLYIALSINAGKTLQKHWSQKWIVGETEFFTALVWYISSVEFLKISNETK